MFYKMLKISMIFYMTVSKSLGLVLGVGKHPLSSIIVSSIKAEGK